MQAAFYKKSRHRLIVVMMFVAAFLTLSGYTTLKGWAGNDTIHLYNGKIIQDCRLDRVVGDIAYYKNKAGRTVGINRLNMNGNDDVVQLRKLVGKQDLYLHGRVHYYDSFELAVSTEEGRVKVPRWRVKRIIMGRPKVVVEEPRYVLSTPDGQVMDDTALNTPVPEVDRNPMHASPDTYPITPR